MQRSIFGFNHYGAFIRRHAAHRAAKPFWPNFTIEFSRSVQSAATVFQKQGGQLVSATVPDFVIDKAPCSGTENRNSCQVEPMFYLWALIIATNQKTADLKAASNVRCRKKAPGRAYHGLLRTTVVVQFLFSAAM